MFVATGVVAQFSPTVDTLRFMSSRGKLYEVITYADDSIQINGIMLQSGAASSTTNWWAYGGAGYITTADPTDQIKYPGIKIWNSGISAPYDAPVWYRKSDNTLRVSTTIATGITATETVTGQVDTYIYETQGADINVNIDSLARIPQSFIIKNNGRNSVVTITPLESGVVFDSAGVTSKTLSYGEWIRITPSATKFITASNEAIIDSVSYYTKTETDSLFVLESDRDSIYRYTALTSGNNNVEVLATGSTVTATLANSNEITFNIPSKVRVLSAKIRTDNLASVVVFMGTSDAPNSSMTDRWMPTVQAWREDTGQQIYVTARMSLTDYTKFEINGLINTTKCHIRITF